MWQFGTDLLKQVLGKKLSLFLFRNMSFLLPDETELRTFFVATTALSLFILCLFFLGGEKKRERVSNDDKKMHKVPFDLHM